MLSTTVRIGNDVKNALKELATQEGESMQGVLEKAVEYYRRQRFLEEVNSAYATLQKDPVSQKSLEKELGEWDNTLLDGLDAESIQTKPVKQKKREKKK